MHLETVMIITWPWQRLHTRRPLTTYRTSFRPTYQLDHSALLPQAASPILPAVQLSLACPDCGASPPSLPSGGTISPSPLELLSPCPSSTAAWRLTSSVCTLTPLREFPNLWSLFLYLSLAPLSSYLALINYICLGMVLYGLSSLCTWYIFMISHEMYLIWCVWLLYDLGLHYFVRRFG